MSLARIVVAWSLLLGAGSPGAPPPRPARTFANPLNLDYRFSLDAPSRREAADPVIVLVGDDYYLFASRSGGYWRSSDLADWTFIKPEGLPIEAYAPAVMVFGGVLYYSACDIGLYRSADPRSGKWEHVGDPFKVGDPDLFADDDGRVYLYYGLSYNGVISGMELDPTAGFRPKSQPFVCFHADYAGHGWERRGDDNLGAVWNGEFSEGPWIEGAWMTKREGVYYLQYAAPGTEFKSYADGVYTARSPRGPFSYAPSSPFSAKPTGFIGGAGHSATFRDKQGHYWHITTMTISTKHMFERRLGLFPADFDDTGVLHVDTMLGDYPQLLPALRKDGAASNLAGMLLLSYGKKATASSSLDGLGPERAFDEDIKSYWSARTAKKEEWLEVDLGQSCRIEAVQVNFAEHEATQLGRGTAAVHQYRLEASGDGKAWAPLADRGAPRTDAPHDYVELPTAVEARRVRLTNLHTPGGGTFSVRDLRIFGACPGAAPAAPTRFEAHRDPSDARSAVLRWDLVPHADGYVIRYGVAPGKLYQSYEVRGRREVTLHNLNTAVPYHLTIDAFNDSGLTMGTVVQKI